MTGTKTKQEWTKLKNVKTPMGRVSFPSVFEAKKGMNEGDKAKFELTLLFPKDADLKAMKAACNAAAAEKFGTDPKKWPKLRMPFRDGDEKKDWEGYPGTIYVSARSDRKPGLVDANREQILDPNDFYAGCYARAEFAAFYYKRSGNEGISFGLNNVQKLKDGPAFSGRKSADQSFDDDFVVSTEGMEVSDSDEDLGF